MSTAVKLKGSGPVTCTCGTHRNRCLFGTPHRWSLYYRDGVLVRTEDTWSCDKCGAVCTADE